jgi:hypothetical protein
LMADDDDNIIPFPKFFRLDPDVQKQRMRSVIRWYRLQGKKPVRVETARGHIAKMARRHETIERTGDDPWCVAKTGRRPD